MKKLLATALGEECWKQIQRSPLKEIIRNVWVGDVTVDEIVNIAFILKLDVLDVTKLLHENYKS